MSYLLENPENGERQWSPSLRGYDGWTVLREGAGTKPIRKGVFNGTDWEVPLATLKADKLAAIMGKLAERFVAGFQPSTGPLAGHTLQVRDADDRLNWSISKARYQQAVDAEAGALPGATFRCVDNVTIGCTFAEGLATLEEMEAWGWRGMARSWVLKDQVNAAADASALDAISIGTGWE